MAVRILSREGEKSIWRILANWENALLLKMYVPMQKDIRCCMRSRREAGKRHGQKESVCNDYRF